MFGFAIMCYLFLGGLGGGLCVVAAMLGLCIPRTFAENYVPFEFRTLLVPCFMMSAAVLIFGTLCLLADGIRIEALERLLFAPKVSFLSLGIWAVMVCVATNVLLAFAWKTDAFVRSTFMMRVLLVFGMFVGGVVVLYTGLFLATMRSVPLWNTPWLPVLFVLSSLSCGIVLAVFIAHIRGVGGVLASVLRKMVKADVLLIVLEAICALGLVLTLLTSDGAGPSATAAATSAIDLLYGKFAWLWWIGFVGIGLFIVIVIEGSFLRRGRDSLFCSHEVAATTFCVLVGAFSLRACFVMAGSHPVLGF